MTEKPGNVELCHAMMVSACECMYRAVKAQVGFLRHGPKCKADEARGKHILKLATARLTAEQLDALEEAMLHVQVGAFAAFLALIDGDRKPEGFPDRIVLLNADTGEPICPGELQWELAAAMAELREQMGNKPEDS